MKTIVFAKYKPKIQDLNDKANMPMIFQCKNYVISYNGELYNKIFKKIS